MRWILASLFSGILAQSGGAAEIPLPEDPATALQSCRSGMERRHTAIASVSYKIVGTRRWLKGAFSEPFFEEDRIPDDKLNPPADIEEPWTRSVLFDFSQSRHRLEWDQGEYSHLAQQTYQIHALNCCDGKTLASRILKNGNPGLRPNQEKRHVDLIVQHGPLPKGVFHEFTFQTVLLAHGIISHEQAAVRPGVLVPPGMLDSLEFVRNERFRDEDCHVLRIPQSGPIQQEYWVAPRRGAVVLKCEYRIHHPLISVELTYDDSADLPLLASWKREEFDLSDGRLKILETATVLATTANGPVKAEEFSIPVESGSYVNEQTYQLVGQQPRLKSERYYIHRPEQPPIELVKETLKPVSWQLSDRGKWFWYGANFLLIALIIGIWVVRRIWCSAKGSIP